MVQQALLSEKYVNYASNSRKFIKVVSYAKCSI